MKTKKSKHSDNKINMYYEQEFQLEQDRLNNVDKKKIKEREKRIKQMNKEKSKIEEKFDFDTETVIGMTNKNNQAKRKEIQKQFDKQERIKQKRKRKIKRFLKWTSIICIISGGTAFALVSPIFNIKEINVSNNNQINTETIVSLSQLNLGQNIFKFNKNKVNKNIKTNALITTELLSKGDNQVQDDVRKQEYNVEFLNGYAYINNQGYILQISEEKQALPTIQGISTPDEQIVEGNRLNSEDLEKLEVIIQIMNICKNYELDSKITNIDISTKDEYTLYLEEEKKTIYLGDKSNLSNKMLYVQVIIEENRGKEGAIFVNGDLNNNFKPRFKEKV